MLSWLNGLRLSISQWLLIMSASAIGLLLLALRVRGGQLYVARIALLRAQMDVATDKQDERVAKARAKLNKALKDFAEKK